MEDILDSSYQTLICVIKIFNKRQESGRDFFFRKKGTMEIERIQERKTGG